MALGATFVDNVALPAFFANAVGTTSGILYNWALPDNAINGWMVEQTRARYGLAPDLFDADGFNAALMLVKGLEATGGDASATALIGAWEGMSFEGPKGLIEIRAEDHVAIQDMYIAELISVDDAETRYMEPVTTTRPVPPCLLPEAMQDRCGDLPYGSLSGQ
jgi:branched-chain amino acid transport system substrate-binding protein